MTFDGLLALRPFVFVSISQANLLSNHLEEQLEVRLERRQDTDRAEWAGKGSELHMLGSANLLPTIVFISSGFCLAEWAVPGRGKNKLDSL